jgi:hypothetical protein
VLGYFLNGFCPATMARKSWQRPLFCPAPIAVHNYGDVPRDVIGSQAEAFGRFLKFVLEALHSTRRQRIVNDAGAAQRCYRLII